MNNLTYSLYNLDLPKDLNDLSKAIRYSQCILEKLTQMESIHYEEITVITLYRKLIENVDGIFILADHHLESPSQSVIRAAYEVFLQLEFIFKIEKYINRRAISYYSTWLFEEVNFIDKQLKNKNKEPLLSRETLILKRESNNKLLEIEFKSYKIEILSTMKRLKINYPPKWYALFNGPKSLSELSKETSLKKVHSVLYNGMSTEAHGLKSITNLSSLNENLVLAPIRGTEIPLMPIHLGRSFLTSTTHKIVNKYLPNQLDEFREFIFTLFEDYGGVE